MIRARSCCWLTRCGTAVLGLCALLAGCHQSNKVVLAAASQPASSLENSAFDPNRRLPYLLYPGDIVKVRYPIDPELDEEQVIRTDGKISLAYIGDVDAARRSPSELGKALEHLYAGVLKNPSVTVIVTRESGRPIYIGGQIRTPGQFALRPNQTLSQALIEAGGFTDLARKEQVLVMRARPQEVISVLRADVSRIIQGSDPDVLLEPFDVIYVPETIIAQVGRFVDQYINSILPRATFFSFTTELHNQPIEVLNNSSNLPPVTITR